MDNRIFLPIVQPGFARTVVLDLTTTSHPFLLNCEKTAGSLRSLVITVSREKPFDESPMMLTARRLEEDEHGEDLIEDFDGVLDRMLAKNVEFWFNHAAADKSAGTGSPLLRVRGAS